MDAYIALGVLAKAIVFYNPMNGHVTRAKTDQQGRVRIQLKSGESIIMRTFDDASAIVQLPTHKYLVPVTGKETVLTHWTLTFRDAAPDPITQTYQMDGNPQ